LIGDVAGGGYCIGAHPELTQIAGHPVESPFRIIDDANKVTFGGAGMIVLIPETNTVDRKRMLALADT
jgi:hypothetical protein